MRAPEPDAGWLAAWRAADALVPPAPRRRTRPVRAQGARRARAGAPGRRAGLAQLLDAGPRRGGLLPAVAQAAALPLEPRRQRDRRRGLVRGRRRAGHGEPAWLLTGELALLHDIGGLFAARRAGADLRVFCLNNGGGGIFDFLPVADAGRSEGLRGAHRHTGFPEELSALLPEVTEIRTDRRTNVALHREVVDRVAAAI